MHRAKFEIECTNPEIIVRAVKMDDNEKRNEKIFSNGDKCPVEDNTKESENKISYTVENNKIILTIQNECLKSLMKIAYSTCNRIQLGIDTIEKFGNKS